MNEQQLQEMIDLQRFKIRTMENTHKRELESIQALFANIFTELNVDEKIVRSFRSAPFCLHNINVTLLQIREKTAK